MKYMASALLGLSLSFSTMANQATAEKIAPPSLEQAKLIQYVESGTYEQELDKAYSEAKSFLESKIKEAKPGEKLAVVFDIDETVLSNWPDMKRLGFTKNKEALVVAYTQAKDPAIKPALALFNYAKANNVAIFFVTGRADSEEIRKASVDNLEAQGYEGWKEMYLRPLSYEKKSISGFKAATRKKLTEEGYTIVLNIGDQDSDLEGGYALKQVKLPNPFYKLAAIESRVLVG